MAITQTTDVTWDQAAYDQLTRFALRKKLIFDRFATVRPTRQSMPGASVVFNTTNDLAAATTPLTEANDVTAATVGDNQITVTLAEYGNAAGRTRRLSGVSYIPVDPVLANLMGYNAGITLNSLAVAPLLAGTNVRYSGVSTARANLTTSSTLNSVDIRYVTAKLRGFDAMTWEGDQFMGVVHPDVSFDLRSETDISGWRAPSVYGVSQDRIWNGEVGAYEGVRWIENTAGDIKLSDVNGTVDGYITLVVGQEAMAKAFSTSESGPLPEVRVSPITDKLWRFYNIGWYWLGGYARFRENCLYRIESASSIGSN